ncbi:phosphatase PAP2 family protein [Anaerovorax odorimutans]|uniref:Phosphatase PAP2 family protein n=2 Tax=Anaerovorax odorimutans TaxID=109327 RepID=A0ABT1RQJ8_9FIRM|nr:phosphatase PAP2 family protein [Anaerovorax odorimutans]
MSKKQTIVMLSGLAGFIIIACFVATGKELAFDTVIREWIYSLRNDVLTPILKVITYMGNWQSITALCILLLIFRQTRFRYGIPVSVGAITVTALNKIIKVIFQRPRPDVSLHLIEQGGYSFTSGHSITSMVVFGMLIYLVRRYVKDKKKANLLTVLLAIPWIFIGLSRIYMGVHFPTDVLGGWCLGLAILMILIFMEEKYTKKEMP